MNIKAGLISIDILCLIFLAFSIAVLVNYHDQLDLVYIFLLSFNCIFPVVIITISILLWYYANNFIKITEPQTKMKGTINTLLSEVEKLKSENRELKTTESRVVRSHVLPY